ncbi:hypothetical protein ANO14919_086480 [Xylariales sp. No.14919]|nr:P-loop containing nucleoside triphosphate hydrolase protein [Xylaria grammica]GAW19164.1 hypothetical protein ANO14919_086480 [Xylariales sp. No.14919]
MSVVIVYLTGATACGKGTLGKRLAAEFGFYHISMGDLRRAHLDSIKLGVPHLDEAIREFVREERVIPPDLLAQYHTVPAVLQYYNHRASGSKGWTTKLAAKMLSEELAVARALAKSQGESVKVIILDGHPLTRGSNSSELVDIYKEVYAGLTIVLETPREVAKQRYLARARSAGNNSDRFESRMELTDSILYDFIELMAGFGEIVYSENNAAMSIDDAYNVLLSNLNKSSTWPTLLALTGNT